MSEVSRSIAASSSYSLWESMNDWFTPKVLFVLLNVMIGTIVFTSSLANRRQKHQSRQGKERPIPKNAGIDRSSSVLQRLKSINLYAQYYRSQEEPQSHNLSHDHTHRLSQDQYSQEYLRQELSVKSQDSYVYEESERAQFVFSEKDPILDGSLLAHEVEAQTQFSFSDKDRILNDSSQLIHEGKTQSQLAYDQANDYTQTHEEKTSAATEQSMDEVYSQLAGGGIHFDRRKSDTKPKSGETPARMRKSASLKSAFGHLEEDDATTLESRRPATSRVSGSCKPTDGDSEVDAKADDFINKFKQQLQLQRLDSINSSGTRT